MSLIACEETRKAYSGGCVNLPDMLEALIHAKGARDQRARLEHLYEAQTLLMDILRDVQAAILANTTPETARVVADRVRIAVDA